MHQFAKREVPEQTIELWVSISCRQIMHVAPLPPPARTCERVRRDLKRGAMRPVCQTYLMSLPRGPAPDVHAGGRLAGRWRYDRTVGRGIALSYDRSVGRPRIARLLNVHAGGRFSGRWRYNRISGRGIALSYEHIVSAPSPATRALPEPISPPSTHSGGVRVLCSCGEVFTFDDDAGVCPGCGRPAEWPTMGEVEREMRSDLKELLSAHEQGPDPD